MNKEKIRISVNQEDVQNIIDCYEKDIEYIKKLEKENQQLKKENTSLRTRIKTIKRIRKKQTQKKNKYKLQIIGIQNSNQQLKQKYLNAVADYESEKSKWETLKGKINEGYRVYRNRGYNLVFEIDEVPKEELNDFICYLATQTMEELIKRIESDEILGDNNE